MQGCFFCINLTWYGPALLLSTDDIDLNKQPPINYMKDKMTKRRAAKTWLAVSVTILSASSGNAQMADQVRTIFPSNTIVYGNIPYAKDTLSSHLLDVYLPANAKAALPLVIWIHGGAWLENDKYADMGYMKNTVKSFIDSGYALASINYRYSTTAKFPAQIQDCNLAVEYLYQHAEKYKLNKDKFALIGFSAGGHLASLLGLSNNNIVKSFYTNGIKPSFKIKTVLDFYGPSDFVILAGAPDTSLNNERNPVSILLGALPLQRPDLARFASPATYIDKGDPPFLIVQGEKDEAVPYTQSVMLHSWLQLAAVENELMIVPGAPHYGVMFDADQIRSRVFYFLRNYLR
jgi:acetyl esterase/lipase